jgi:DNA polymerase-3 subunit epsilon
MKEKILYFDLETTGVEKHRHGIHQIAGCIVIDGEIKEHFNFKVAPNPKAKIEPEALEVGGVTEEQIKAYPSMKIVFFDFCKMLGKYVDKYDKQDKFHLCGYNNRSFDDQFLRAWFVQSGDNYFGSWFWADSLDVIVLCSEILSKKRTSLADFKLKTVAAFCGIEVDETQLHDASYDIMLTKKLHEWCRAKITA